MSGCNDASCCLTLQSHRCPEWYAADLWEPNHAYVAGEEFAAPPLDGSGGLRNYTVITNYTSEATWDENVDLNQSAFVEGTQSVIIKPTFTSAGTGRAYMRCYRVTWAIYDRRLSTPQAVIPPTSLTLYYDSGDTWISDEFSPTACPDDTYVATMTISGTGRNEVTLAFSRTASTYYCDDCSVTYKNRKEFDPTGMTPFYIQWQSCPTNLSCRFVDLCVSGAEGCHESCGDVELPDFLSLDPTGGFGDTYAKTGGNSATTDEHYESIADVAETYLTNRTEWVFERYGDEDSCLFRLVPAFGEQYSVGLGGTDVLHNSHIGNAGSPWNGNPSVEIYITASLRFTGIFDFNQTNHPQIGFNIELKLFFSASLVVEPGFPIDPTVRNGVKWMRAVFETEYFPYFFSDRLTLANRAPYSSSWPASVENDSWPDPTIDLVKS